jgi:hypothetical protein
VTTSQGCPCTFKKRQNAEAALTAALAKHRKAPRLERIDQATEAPKAGAMLQRFPSTQIPVLYFLNEKGELLTKLEGEFSEADVSQALDQYAGRKR